MVNEKSFPSPDGRYRLDLVEREARMSHYIDSPYLFDLQTGSYVLDFGLSWSCEAVAWKEGGRVLDLELRCYPDGSSHFYLTLDFGSDQAELRWHELDKTLAGPMREVALKMAQMIQLRNLFK